MSNVLIKTIGLKKYFKVPEGNLHAVDNINLCINEGETLGVVGESGCGKTTLGRTLLRLHEPTEGEIWYENQNITALSRKQMKTMRNKMQIIFQDPYSSIDPRMSVEELIAEPMIINRKYKTKREMMERVHSLMDTVGLAERLTTAYPHELDGGRRQRIGIARALSLDPRFIVCDEPVSALDVSIQAQILNLMMDLQQDMDLTYMFITHDLSVVRHISTDIAVMYLGQCIELSPSRELFNNPKHPYTHALLAAIPVPTVNARDKKVQVIRGEVSNPVNPKSGCRFAPRCPYVSDLCSAPQQLTEISPKHYVACHLASEDKIRR